MSRKSTRKTTPPKESLVIRTQGSAVLSRTQMDFNRLMKSLESAKSSHAREQARLDDTLLTSSRELMPLIEDLNRTDRDLVFKGYKAFQTLKLNAHRKHWFGDLLSGKASELLADPVGLSAEEITELELVVREIGPSTQDQRAQEEAAQNFEFLREMIEQAASHAGHELDLSDLDPHGDPAEFMRSVQERLGANAAFLKDLAAPPHTSRRKPTKAQIAKEQARLALEEAKTRDLKSLFKQLAKAFHPDLEPDPLLKQQRQVWMQRLNTAYAQSDLREMLQLEMEWLGEESTNLATAGDEKLKVYCMVLKEQIADIKRQTQGLPHEPQYSPLRRFMDPFFGNIANPKTIKREIQDHLRHNRNMLEILDANNANSRRMIYEWIEEHAESSATPF
jgi:hypothetical protein